MDKQPLKDWQAGNSANDNRDAPAEEHLVLHYLAKMKNGNYQKEK